MMIGIFMNDLSIPSKLLLNERVSTTNIDKLFAVEKCYRLNCSIFAPEQNGE